MDTQPADEEGEECVPISYFLATFAHLSGRIQALEATLAAILAERNDLDALHRRVDAVLVHDEASRLTANLAEEQTMKIQEVARQASEAVFANAVMTRRL